MQIDQQAAAHFREGRAALIRKRDEVNRAIEAVDAILATLDIAPAEDTGALNGGARINPPRKRRSTGGPHAVLAALEGSREGAVWTPQQVHAALQEMEVRWDYATTRSTVAKMARDGVLTKVRRGIYRLPDPTDAESPEAPGLSVMPPPPEGVERTG